MKKASPAAAVVELHTCVEKGGVDDSESLAELAPKDFEPKLDFKKLSPASVVLFKKMMRVWGKQETVD